MMNTHSINIEDTNTALLFEQVMGQMVEQCMQTGIMTKQQIVNIMEDMIQQVERGTLSSTLDRI
ncbi:MAG: hypothetical protein HMLIMOIP_001997 [Candidatus Nitrosomirales archaeon]|jgi:hypothetical protein